MKAALITEEQIKAIEDALEDMLSGWKYIRESHGDLYGIGWDRAESKAVKALTIVRSLKVQEPVAWITRRTGDGGVVISGYETCEPTDYDAIPVYTAPTKREWQALAQPEQEPVANEVRLNIIRWWPDGFANQLEHVWKDLIGFIPNYKLLDLQRLLAEFGFTMKIYEGEAPTISEPIKERISEPVENLEPVAYMHTCGSDIQINTLPAHCYGNNWTRTPLYTAPPSKPWVSLTDEELNDVAEESEFGYKNLARAIEAALKEKNNDN